MSDNRAIVAGLDLGSSQTRCFAGALEKHSLRYAGSASVPSRGWRKGRVTDPQALVDTVREVITRVEFECGHPIEKAVLGLGGPTVRSFNSRGIREIGPRREIVQLDVNRTIERACGLNFFEDQMILQVFPQYFIVDEDGEYRDPRGIPGSLLEANVHIIVGSKAEHANLIAACNQAHLEVEDSVFEPVATALGSVLPEDRADGVALVDIGLHSSELLVYWRDILVHSCSLPVSAEHFTRDVARALHVSPPDAERIKIEYGCALVGLTADNSFIEIPALNGAAPREAERRFLNLVLEARGRELFEIVQKQLAGVGMSENLGTGIVLAGGGSLLPGMCDLAEQVLNCPARLALPIGFRDLPACCNEAAWATAAGLAMYASRLRAQERQRREQEGLLVKLFG